MKRIFAIALCVYVAYLAEFVLYNSFGIWGKPQMMVLTIIFCDLYWGVRYAIWAAFVAGLIKSAFAIEPFGMYLLIYLVGAYTSTLIRQNFYQPGSQLSRLFLTFLVCSCIFILEMLLHMRLFEVRVAEALWFVLPPPLILTLLVANLFYTGMRDTAVQFKL